MTWKQTAGICLGCGGKYKLSTEGYSELNDTECLKTCSKYPGVKGCRHNSEDNSCFVYTEEMSYGDGRPGIKCWVSPTNCVKGTFQLY